MIEQIKDPKDRFKNDKLTQKLREIPLFFFEENKEPATISSRATVLSGLAEYTGSWDELTSSHLLKRCLFGVKKSEIDYFKTLSMSEAVDQVISSSPSPAPPVNDYAPAYADIEDPDVLFGETWINAPHNNDIEGYRILSLKSWILNNILEQEPSLHQKMTLFWHNLLVTQFWDLNIAKASYKYYKMLFDHAFGNYKSLIKQLTIDPAMLFFLNGTYNNKEAPDENYARELQELFCIGKGPDSNYTESDVQQAAKVLTGWVVDWQNTILVEGEPDSFFYAPYHDTSDKQFSSFYENKVIEGKAGDEGANETDELIDMIFDNSETALYICRRLYNFFVYHEIDEETESNIIIPLAQILRDANFQIEPVLRTLFKSEHFYDAANRGAQIKNPMDHLLGLWRTMEVPRSEDLYAKLVINNSLLWSISEVGMELGDPPSVSGWQAYYQDPTYDRFWINTDTIIKRTIRQDSLIYWGHWVSENLQINADLIGFVSTFDNPGDPVLLIEEMSLLLLGIPLSIDAVEGMTTILNGDFGNGYWASIWYDFIYDSENEEKRVTVENRLKAMLSPFMQLSEFQLM
ncbi:DUF1800 domain-containing protein [Ekhidna sp.]|uniref:DUF1800 domain-containing protein n=1 Tax=Ekhidna sp. TaxID=2608089 RepID=UPI003BABB865